MTPERLFFTIGAIVATALVGIVSLFAIVLVKNWLSSKKTIGHKKGIVNGNGDIGIPDDQTLLFEELQVLASDTSETGWKTYQERVTAYWKAYQTSEAFDLLGILLAHVRLVEDKNDASILKMAQALGSSDETNNIRYYQLLYSHLSSLRMQTIATALVFQEPVNVPVIDSTGFRFEESGSVANRKLRVQASGLLDCLSTLFESVNFVRGLASKEPQGINMEMVDEQIDHISEVRSLRMLPAREYWPTETGLTLEVAENLLTELAEISEQKVDSQTRTLKLAPEEIRVPKSESIELALTVTNESKVMREDVFLLVGAYKSTKIDRSVLSKKTIGHLDPMESRQVPIPVFPDTSANNIDVSVELGYRTANGPEVSRRIVLKVVLINRAELYSERPYHTSPLAAPITSFVGREDEIRRIQKHITSDSGQIIGITGLARIGKTALLFEMVKRDSSKMIVFAYVSMDRFYFSGHDRQNWLDAIIFEFDRSVRNAAQDAGIHLPRLTKKNHPQRDFMDFLSALESELRRREKYLVLAIDEYHRIEIDTTPANRGYKRDIIRLFKQVAISIDRISVLLCGYHDIQTLSRSDGFWNEALAKGFESIRLSFLSRREAIQLIRNPMASFGFQYDGGVDQEIASLTSGYPWHIHLICSRLFEILSDEYLWEEIAIDLGQSQTAPNVITMALLNHVLDTIVDDENTEIYFTHLFVATGPSKEYQVDRVGEAIVYVVGQASEEVIRYENGLEFVSREYVLEQLHNYGVKLEMGSLISRMESLERKDILVSIRVDRSAYYAISIPLLRIWSNRRADVQATLAQR